MPNAARLVAALCLGFLGMIVSVQVMPLFPEGTDFGLLVPVNIGLGVLVGWIFMGKRAGRGSTSAINNGLTGVVVLVFWALFVQGCNEMVRLAMRNRYGGPFEALTDIIRIGVEYGQTIFTVPVLISLVIGAVVSGLATEYAWGKWR